jgi:hypothetical protein
MPRRCEACSARKRQNRTNCVCPICNMALCLVHRVVRSINTTNCATNSLGEVEHAVGKYHFYYVPKYYVSPEIY